MKPEEIAALAKHAGLDLSASQLEELVTTFGAVIEPMLQRLRRNRCRFDEPAHVFDPRKFMPVDV
ncbi:hypothetical protein SLT36_30915 (plasmid) [Aminobacter sp. BA135]|uniref:hypothetical protein n=1 Tax=Aminobacter sp. BA135 TaxID=537596 RepID=UPI003D79C304